ncbi:MAG: cytochrome c assembly protein, partial [Bacteroidetes bacterium]
MEKLIRQSWWKALGVLILLYVFVAGMLIPLKPGIMAVSPSSARTGDEITVDIQAYNTHFDEAEDTMRVWLKLDNERMLAATRIEVQGPTQARARFQLPEYLPSDQRVQDFTLIVD